MVHHSISSSVSATPSFVNESIGTWAPSTIPTSTFLTSINPTYASAVVSQVSSIQLAVKNETDITQLYFLSQQMRGALATLTIIQGEQYLATATATQEFPMITSQMFNATLNLQELADERNLFGMHPNRVANILFTSLYGILFIIHLVLGFVSGHVYFSLCLCCGTAVEFAGYVARVLAYGDESNENKFLCQIVCLTMAPAYIMAGVYYLLAQVIVIYGRKCSILRPLLLSYIFVVCDCFSLIIQAAGGGMASVALSNHTSLNPGTFTMVGGIAFQVFSMSLFILFLFDFYYRAFFCSHVEFGFLNFINILLQTKQGHKMSRKLEPYYNPEFKGTRRRPLFKYISLVFLVAVCLVYVRCVYRVVELAEGWNGFLITREAYPMSLDGAMIFITSTLFVVFHPRFIFGKNCHVSVKTEVADYVEFDSESERDRSDESRFEKYHSSLREI